MPIEFDKPDALAWLDVLFEEDDIVELRAFAKHTDPDAKPRRRWFTARDRIAQVNRMEAWNREGYDIYCGVCPRTEKGGGKAEHVAGARCLWLDFDGIEGTPTEQERAALQRCAAEALPLPSMTCHSGHGVHFFWLLDALETDTDRIEAVVKGMQQATGADPQSTDRARILRVAGSYNHKPPAVPSRLIAADASVRYPLSTFERFAPTQESPEPTADGNGVEAAHAAAETSGAARAYDPTTQPGAAISIRERAERWMEKRDPAVQGSGGDVWTFKTACALVRGFMMSDEDAYALLSAWNTSCSPPWSEAGLREKIGSARRNGKEPMGYLLEDNHGRNAATHAGGTTDSGRDPHAGEFPAPDADDPSGDESGSTGASGDCLSNYRTDFVTDNEGQRRPKNYTRHIRKIVSQVLDDLGDSFGRLGSALFYARDGMNRLGEAVAWMDGSIPLFGFLQDRYGRIRWKDKADCVGVNFVSRGEFHDQLRDRAPAYLAITGYPFEPLDSRVFCKWTPPENYAPDGSALAGFLDFFNPATDRDADLLAAMVLTLFWGDAPGGRPLFVLTGDERGVQQGIGKSVCARYCSNLVGNAIELEMPKRGSFADGLKKQALEEVNLHKRVGLLDNHTGTLRDDTLTDLVTAQMIAGRASYAKQAERLNLITWIVTTNEPNLSDDISSRTVLIRLSPADRAARPHWEKEIRDFIATRAGEIAADCIDILAHGPEHGITEAHTRFSAWDCAVLAKLETVNECLKHIRETAEANNSDTDEIMEFLEALHAEHPGPNPAMNDMDDVEWLEKQAEELRIKELVEIWEEALGKEFNVAALGRILKNARARGKLHGLDKKSKKNGAPWSWKPWIYREAVGAAYPASAPAAADEAI